MSLVIAAISYRSRSSLHKASISAVLPEPTGPPTPTRRGPWDVRMLSAPEQPRVLRLVAHARNIAAEGGAADVIEAGDQRTPRGRGHHRLERGKHALAVGLAKRDEPHAGRDQVRRHCVEKGMQRSGKRNAVPRAGNPDRDRQRDVAVPDRKQ